MKAAYIWQKTISYQKRQAGALILIFAYFSLLCF
jgi:hypothetical protein